MLNLGTYGTLLNILKQNKTVSVSKINSKLYEITVSEVIDGKRRNTYYQGKDLYDALCRVK